MNKEEFIEYLCKLNINLTTKQLEQLEQYYNLLITENKKYNLTAITKKEDVYLKHFYDSLTLSKIEKLKDQYICDIGTGAGFPGIVLKIVFPDIKLDLIESNTKKCKFLFLIVETLSLENVNIINERAEEYAKKYREKYDIVTSRAVAPLSILLEYSIPMVKVNGKFIALKGKIDEELAKISNYYKKLNIKQIKTEKFFLPIENAERSLISFIKKKETNTMYPRKYNEIRKNIL